MSIPNRVNTTFAVQQNQPWFVEYNAMPTHGAMIQLVAMEPQQTDKITSWVLVVRIGHDEVEFPLQDLVDEPYAWDLDQWLAAYLEQTPGFDDQDDEEDEVPRDDAHRHYVFQALRDRFPQIAQRALTIYTFGRRHRKRVPQSQANFHAAVLSGRRRGLNLKKLNGLSPDVQQSVQTSRNFDTFMTQLVEKVERDNLQAISISCTAGRHRSVTCGELLKKYLYSEAIVYHMELNRMTR